MKYCIKCEYQTEENMMFCPDCQCKLEDGNSETIAIEEEKISGINKSELCHFIDSNQARYIEIFEKNQDKKIFIKTNWAAMLFSLYWLFYRKMYKEGFLFLLISIVLASVVMGSALAVYKGQLHDLKQEAASSYSNNAFDTLNDAVTRQQKSNELTGKISFFIIVPSLVLGIIFGLFADCIYRRYVFKNIQYKEGGVSKISILAAVPLIFLARFINELISSGLISIIWGDLIK